MFRYYLRLLYIVRFYVVSASGCICFHNITYFLVSLCRFDNVTIALVKIIASLFLNYFHYFKS